jgi:hypothetical protein
MCGRVCIACRQPSVYQPSVYQPSVSLLLLPVSLLLLPVPLLLVSLVLVSLVPLGLGHVSVVNSRGRENNVKGTKNTGYSDEVRGYYCASPVNGGPPAHCKEGSTGSCSSKPKQNCILCTLQSTRSCSSTHPVHTSEPAAERLLPGLRTRSREAAEAEP